jgi:hypothetical protein
MKNYQTQQVGDLLQLAESNLISQFLSLYVEGG